MKLNLKKSLGQHFLIDHDVLRHIVSFIPISKGERILEIGPGGGALTDYIIPWIEEYHIDFKAYEIDQEKVIYLQKKYPSEADRIIMVDVLQAPEPWDLPFIMVGNFPYNISSQILFKMIDWKDQVTVMIGMFQKEVADRIVSREGNKVYGILSVIVQAFFDVSNLLEINPEAFDPPPKVTSSILRCTNNGNKYGIEKTKAFIKLVKAGFQFRRKTLRNNLQQYFTKEELMDPFFDQRAEQLSVATWTELYHRIYNQK